MGRKSTISRLPAQIKRHIEGRIAQGRLTLAQLIAELHDKFPDAARMGELPSRAAVQRYGQKLDQRLAAIRASTEAARLISEQIGDKTDARSEALMALVQSELFDAIMALQNAGEGQIKPEERLQLLSTVGKNISTIARGSVNLKEFQAKTEAATRKALLEEQRARLDALGRAGEVDQATLDKVIRAAYGM